MPGDEVGDRDHNFFSQESFSQGQGRFEVVERSWPVLNNNLRAGSERQSSYPFITNSRNASVFQSDANAGHVTSPFHAAHGLNISQSNSNLKPGFSDGLFPNQQTPLNGFVQGNHVFPGMQNESNILDMDSKPESKGLSILNSQQVKGSEVQRNPSRMLNPEAAVNFDFLGAQEQVNSNHSGALRFLQGQQANVNDVQLLQQQVLLKKLQDVQRQQLQQQGIWQSSLNQFHSLEKPGMPLNGIPVNDASNYSWQHEFGTNNTNQLQRGASAVMQGSPGGVTVPPQHGQGFHVMGAASHHNDHSHYGVPISVSEKRFSQSSQLDYSTMQRMPSSAPSVTCNLFATSDQAHVQNGVLIPKQLGNSSHSSVQFNSDVLQQGDSLQRNASMQLEGQQAYIGYTETPEVNPLLSPVPQNEATLDPTEERILFGSDDNIWGAFGMGTAPVASAFSVADGTGLPAGFPSVQSGSWSALMQSALAETSSDNQGTQEEWSGLSVQNVETTIQMSRHNSLSDDPRLSAWSNGNMHPSSSSTRPFQLSINNGSATVSATSGVRQSDVSPSYVESEKMHTDSSPRWQLDRSHLQNHSLEGLQNHANVANSSDSEAKRIMSGSFDQQRNIVNPNNWKVLESKIADEHSMLKNQDTENFVQTMSSRSSSLGNSASPGATGEDSQQLPHHHGFDFWRSASSPMNFKGIQEDRNAPVAESSGNNDMRERGHENKRNFAGAFRTNSANHTPSSAVRKNAWLYTGESSNLHDGLQNQSVAGFQKLSARKFQYHPMGNVDTGMESSYGIKQGAAKSMISHDRGYMDQRLLGHAKLVGNADGTTISSEKADLRGTEAARRGMMGYAPDKQSGNGLNKNVQSSHNMLELLHKVDQSKEHVVSPHLSSSERNDNNETETSDGSVGHFQLNQLPSKGFSLQLAPPSPRLQNFNRASPSQNPSTTLPGSQPLSSKVVSTSSIQSLSSLRETPAADCGNSIFSSPGSTSNKIPVPNFQGNVSRALASGFPFPVNQPPNQLDIGAHGSVGPLQSMIGSSNQIPGQSDVMDSSHERLEVRQTDVDTVPSIPSKAELTISNQTRHGLPQFPASQSSLIVPEQAPLSRVLPDAWIGTSNQQHLLSAIPGNSTLGLVSTQPKYINQVDTASSGLQKSEFQKGGHGPSEYDEPVKIQGFHGKDQIVKEPSSEVAGPSQGTVQGKESLMKPLSDSPLSTSGRLGKVEAFDGYLRPSNSMGHYSLLHQVQAFKTANVDHDNRAMKRLKGLSSLESQSVSLEGEKTSDNNNLPGRLPNVRNVDSETRHFSNRSGESQGVSRPSPDAVIVSSDGCPSILMSNKIASVGGEDSKINHQMAPPEFEQYGGLINGNMYRMDDAKNMAVLKSMQQPMIFHKPAFSVQMQSVIDVHQAAFAANCIGNLLNRSTPTGATSEPPLPNLVLPLGASDPSFQLKSRKRKIIGPEKLSWHKEVTAGFGRVQEISVAEIEWAKSCNRLAVKLDYEREQIEDGTSLQRPRRRLLLTTQLMQLLIQPPAAAFLCGDAVINIENVVYSTTRKTLGDACSMILCSNSSPDTHNNDEKTNSERPEVSEESDDEQRLAKAIEYLVGRTRTLTNELSRLDRRYSIADLRAECQDLEKFSIINRFAKFHGRGHAEVVGMSSSSDGAASLLKFCPQRYVTALPMPRNLPDRIQCLSL
ncbi:hypothetical protein MLD38_032797 [Melastoma candidum]|uniref:Uncharacterized protein n=1 Tax=Melastoma candidum TaxID=119954 RepID=A0ACB9M760_9MYRT|nr:hypothetical protein MLD38_032797 [Melastoma candidum]